MKIASGCVRCVRVCSRDGEHTVVFRDEACEVDTCAVCGWFETEGMLSFLRRQIRAGVCDLSDVCG